MESTRRYFTVISTFENCQFYFHKPLLSFCFSDDFMLLKYFPSFSSDPVFYNSLYHFYVDLLVLSGCLGNDPSDVQVTTKLVYQLILRKYDTT